MKKIKLLLLAWLSITQGVGLYSQTEIGNILDQYILLPESYEDVDVSSYIEGSGCYDLVFNVIPEASGLGYPSIGQSEHLDYSETMSLTATFHYAGFDDFLGHPNDEVWIFDESGRLVEKNTAYDNPFYPGEKVYYLGVRGSFSAYDTEFLFYSGALDMTFEVNNPIGYEVNKITGNAQTPFAINLAPVLFDIQGSEVNTKIVDSTYNGGVCLEVNVTDCSNGTVLDMDTYCYEIGEPPLCLQSIVIEEQPEEEIVCINEQASLSVLASGGNPPLSYQWRRFCEVTFDNWTTATGLSDNFTFEVYRDNGVLYAATNGGLSVSSDEGVTWTTYDGQDGLANNTVYDVYVTGGVWYAATANGLSISSDSGMTWTTYNASNGLESNIIYSVYVESGTIYVGTTRGLGISSDGGQTWQSLGPADGLGHHFVNDVYVADGNIYAGTYNGLSISSDGGVTWTNYGIADDLASSYILGVYKSDGTLYVATSGGVSSSVNEGISWTNYTVANGLGSNFVYSIQEDEGLLYAATFSGVSISSDGGTSWMTYRTPSGLLTNKIYGIYGTGGKLYVATFGGGIASAEIYTDIAGATASNYTFAPNFPEDGLCEYQVLIEDAYGCTKLSDRVAIRSSDCEIDCADSYEGINQLTGMQAMNEDFETAGGIDSDQLIISGARVDYDATTDIDLLPGFEVQLGAELDAFIDGCNDGAGGNQ